MSNPDIAINSASQSARLEVKKLDTSASGKRPQLRIKMLREMREPVMGTFQEEDVQEFAYQLLALVDTHDE